MFIASVHLGILCEFTSLNCTVLASTLKNVLANGNFTGTLIKFHIFVKESLSSLRTCWIFNLIFKQKIIKI